MRELFKVSGFSVGTGKFIDLGSISAEGGVIEGHSSLFVAVLTEPEEKVLTSELGHGEMVFYSQNKINDLIERGKI